MKELDYGGKWRQKKKEPDTTTKGDTWKHCEVDAGRQMVGDKWKQKEKELAGHHH